MRTNVRSLLLALALLVLPQRSQASEVSIALGKIHDLATAQSRAYAALQAMGGYEMPALTALTTLGGMCVSATACVVLLLVPEETGTELYAVCTAVDEANATGLCQEFAAQYRAERA